jgi:hypothetical protein
MSAVEYCDRWERAETAALMTAEREQRANIERLIREEASYKTAVSNAWGVMSGKDYRALTKASEKATRDRCEAQWHAGEKFARERGWKMLRGFGWSPIAKDDVGEGYRPLRDRSGLDITLIHTRASWDKCIEHAIEQREIVSQVSDWSWYGSDLRPMLFVPIQYRLKYNTRA